jgi:hypothetical protein
MSHLAWEGALGPAWEAARLAYNTPPARSLAACVRTSLAAATIDDVGVISVAFQPAAATAALLIE